MPDKNLLEQSIKKAAKDDRISCAVLRKIAEKHNVSYKSAGRLADELHIRIKNCDLGCFLTKEPFKPGKRFYRFKRSKPLPLTPVSN